MVGGIDEADGSVLPTGGSGDAPRAPGSMQELLTRLPQPRGASRRAGDAVQPPLQPNREFRSATIDEPPVLPSEDPRADVRERPAATPDEQEPRVHGLPLPQRVTRISTGRKVWFGVSFVLPVILGAIYLFLIAPDQYVTEFRFSVRVPVGQQGALASGGASTSALFGGNPTPGTDLLDNFTVADYVESSQAAADLDTKVNLKGMYNKPGDPFSRVGSNATREKLARYWKSMIYSDYDVTTGLAVVRVKAYSAQDSYAIATSLLQLSNDLVNSIGNQSQQDTVHFAERQVARANQQVTSLRREIAALSQKRGIDSPSSGILAANVALATNSRTNVAQIKAQISELMGQLHNADAPQIQALRQELVGNESALNDAVRAMNELPTNQFADLQNEVQNSLTVLASAQAALSNARAGADAQRLYLTTYVKPSVPESPGAPDRWIDLLMVIVVAAMVWTVGLLFRNSLLEHG